MQNLKYWIVHICRFFYSFIRHRPAYYKKVKTWGLRQSEDTSPKVIVSLTSFPARIRTVSYTIESLLSQEYKPDKVVLWLAESQFPRKSKQLPRKLLALQEYGLTIKWTSDIRSYKKLIPSLKEFPEDIIVTTDDDVYYRPDWLKKLYTSYLLDKNAIHCHRAHLIKLDNYGNISPYNKWGNETVRGPYQGFDILMTGVGGVLYPPHVLYKDSTNESIFYSIAKNADDIWFWAMAVLQHTKINVVADNDSDCDPVFIIRDESLWDINQGGNNDIVIANLYGYYPQIKKILTNEL